MIKEIISVSELRAVLLEIDNCQNDVSAKYIASDEITICNLEVPCDACIERMAGLLNWAEDLEDEMPTDKVEMAQS